MQHFFIVEHHSCSKEKDNASFGALWICNYKKKWYLLYTKTVKLWRKCAIPKRQGEKGGGQGQWQVNSVLSPSETWRRTHKFTWIVVINFCHWTIIPAISWPPPLISHLFTLAFWSRTPFSHLGCFCIDYSYNANVPDKQSTLKCTIRYLEVQNWNPNHLVFLVKSSKVGTMPWSVLLAWLLQVASKSKSCSTSIASESQESVIQIHSFLCYFSSQQNMWFSI